MSNAWKDGAVVNTADLKHRDPRPLAVQSQDAAILEYAARNRLLRGRGTPGDGKEPETPFTGRIRRRHRRKFPRTAARAEALYRQIAPTGQKYPLQAVTLVRKLLREGAPEEFVLEKYRTHAWACDEIGVPPMPFIPYLAELLEVWVLDVKSARRNAAIRNPSIPS